MIKSDKKKMAYLIPADTLKSRPTSPNSVLSRVAHVPRLFETIISFIRRTRAANVWRIVDVGCYSFSLKVVNGDYDVSIRRAQIKIKIYRLVPNIQHLQKPLNIFGIMQLAQYFV